MHVPAEVQTLPRPQGLPVGRRCMVSTQPALVPHVVSPSLHESGLLVHAVPAEQVTHEPPRHTRSLPQPVPFGAAGPSMQEAAPAWQNVTPWRHGAPVFPTQGWLS